MKYALVLHAHLPYVRPTGPETLEEHWLQEAVAETYLPLLRALERLQRDQAPVRLALSLSGPLLSMLADEGLMSRCRQRLNHLLDLAVRRARTCAGGPLEPAASFHRDRLATMLADLDRRGGDLITSFAELERAGLIELFTAAGSHGYLPLLATDAGRAAQIEAGLAEFYRHFGHRPAGIWLPECAFSPGLDHLLSSAGIRWFVTEAAMVAVARPAVPPGTACVLTPAGVAAFARDPDASRRVWDSRSGYPGDPAYREFYRDEGYDLPLAEVSPWLVEGRVRSDTGLKFHRVEGAWPHKEPYIPALAARRVREHAGEYARMLAGRTGLSVTPFDAELLGHWWFEGTDWAEALFRELAALDGAVEPCTPTEYLSEFAAGLPVVQLPAGSWGAGENHSFWVSSANDFLWPRLHDAELRMLEIAHESDLAPGLADQAARELLLAQASDWPFLLANGTAVDYARQRVLSHLDRFDALLAGRLNPAEVAVEDGIFAGLDGRSLYSLPGSQRAPGRRGLPGASQSRPVWTDVPANSAIPTRLRILMLSWEFPPGNVGGLGRHVCDLGEALAALGHSVDVITLADDVSPPGLSCEHGIAVHRVERPPENENFLSWVYRYNLAMVDAALRATADGCTFDVVHCHDWLVAQAGMALKARWGLPLIATIHATERGRVGAICEPGQAAIHAEEWQLARAADAVITVSRAMAREVWQSFRIPATVIHNGVKVPSEHLLPPRTMYGPYFFFVGRLVAEKGVQVAIRALSLIRAAGEAEPDLVVAGSGPMESRLRRLAAARGLTDRVHFIGRVSDAAKEAWLHHAVAGLVPSLYEPFGIAALEIMAAGIPAIVSDVGGLAEIVIQGENGLKAAPGDPGSFAMAMSSLMENRSLASHLARAGRRTAATRFAWPTIAAQTLDVYAQACQLSTQPRSQEECL